MNDAELLHAYVKDGSEPAFHELVERHKGMVYASALRQAGDPALAEDITQAVFIVLANKAPMLPSGVILSGWLFRATRFAVFDALKSNRRRIRREHEAYLMNSNSPESPHPDASWKEIASVLDESLARLGTTDRHALLLRFFEQKNLAEVGHSLGISEDGARKRVQRALEKLRSLLGQRGVVVPATILASSLAAHGAPAAPATLAAAGSTAASASVLSLAKSTLALMAWSKTKIALIAATAVLLINGAAITVFLAQHQRSPRPQIPEIAAPSASSFSEDELVTTTFVEPSPEPNGFISLFNGRDLTGWNFNPQVWSVSNGVIRAQAPPDSRQTVHYMAWAGGAVDDFELRLKVRTTANANSGVPLRARWAQQRWFPGYQAEIHGQRSGLLVIAGAGRERMLCAEGQRTVSREQDGQDVLETVEPLPDSQNIFAAREAIERGEWVEFGVIAEGTRFIIRINGVTVIDTRDEHPMKFVSRGMMGLEYSHRRGTNDAVEFKEILFRRLPASTTAP
jgi:RNA polymerase sigma factor (sigma-70 family)